MLANMEWLYIGPIKTNDAISEYELLVGYCFPNDFKEYMNINDGAHPKRKIFISTLGEEKEYSTTYFHLTRTLLTPYGNTMIGTEDQVTGI